jgi:hypothetical protein
LSIEKAKEDDLESEKLCDVREHLEAEVQRVPLLAIALVAGGQAMSGVESHLSRLRPKPHLKPVLRVRSPIGKTNVPGSVNVWEICLHLWKNFVKLLISRCIKLT